MTAPEEPSLDGMLDVLSNRYRRRVLAAMLEHNPQDDDDTQVPEDTAMGDEDLEALEQQMVHVHLPKLADLGFVEWDREENVVRKGPRFDEIKPLLELMADHEDELPEDWL